MLLTVIEVIISNLLRVFIIISSCLGVEEEKDKVMCFSACVTFKGELLEGEPKGVKKK